MDRTEVLDIIRALLEKNGFSGLSDDDIMSSLKAAINNEFAGDNVAMTIYGLLESELMSMASEIEKIVERC